MSGYFGIVPVNVLNHKELTAEEIVFYVKITTRLNKDGACTDSNKTLSAILGKDKRTLQRMIKHLQDCKVISVEYNGPLRKMIPLFVAPNTTKVSPYRYREILPEHFTPAQRLFHASFPNRIVNCAVPTGIDMPALIEKIKESPFLSSCENINLNFFIENYKMIMRGAYRHYSRGAINNTIESTRQYNDEDFNKLFWREP